MKDLLTRGPSKDEKPFDVYWANLGAAEAVTLLWALTS